MRLSFTDEGKFYFDDHGYYHNDNGPAAIYADGSKYWYIHGKLHREDGPAVETKQSSHWFMNDKLHRLDGPAIVYYDDNIFNTQNKLHDEWYYNGKYITVNSQERFIQYLKLIAFT
jgi:hypothetical protein